jgi:hypothetical protein
MWLKLGQKGLVVTEDQVGVEKGNANVAKATKVRLKWRMKG